MSDSSNFYTAGDVRRWQRDAAHTLTRLLKRAADAELPAISWTVHPGRELRGEVMAREEGDRVALFELWKTHLDLKEQRPPVLSLGVLRLRATGRLDGVHISLTVDIFEDEQ